MIETGIYGGSFNPIHNGHVRLAEALCRQGWVDELWLMVSPLNPLKQQSRDMMDDDTRLRLARLAVKDIDGVSVCDAEFRLPRPSYTVHTLEHLRHAHPERRFSLVIGADNWQAFPRWYRGEEIVRHHRLIIYPRPGYPLRAEELPPYARLADTPLLDISSTQIREKLKRGEDISTDVPEAVREYFIRNS
ncbi:MAG: nicotinate (nicotinamide) nucleotide adenylyltransferase [Clostridium sp.]|nr:nicotinate (nicotinamide) nucleotide adenylyltransferase [Clostridium sp.]